MYADEKMKCIYDRSKFLSSSTLDTGGLTFDCSSRNGDVSCTFEVI